MRTAAPMCSKSITEDFQNKSNLQYKNNVAQLEILQEYTSNIEHLFDSEASWEELTFVIHMANEWISKYWHVWQRKRLSHGPYMVQHQ